MTDDRKPKAEDRRLKTEDRRLCMRRVAIARAPQRGSAGGHLAGGGRGPLMHKEFTSPPLSLPSSPLPSLLWFPRKRGDVSTPPWAQRRAWGLRVVLRRAGQGGGTPSSFGRAGPPGERRGRVLSQSGSTLVLPCNSHIGSQAWADRVAPGTNPSLGDPIGQGASLLPRVKYLATMPDRKERSSSRK